MPTIVMTKQAGKLDGSMKKKAYAFLEKLTETRETTGLHIEPIAGAADPRVRTGRVDQQYRAVLFELADAGDDVFVIAGIWKHDDAYAWATSHTLTTNPVSGIAEIRTVEPAAPALHIETPPPTPTPAPVDTPPRRTPEPLPHPPPPRPSTRWPEPTPLPCASASA